MKNAKKALILVLCAALLVGASVMGTLAYLTSQTGRVENTFTVGKVEITLKEYEINPETGKKLNPLKPVDKMDGIKVVPGRTIDKHAFITVADKSEACYIFVEIVNGLGNDATIKMADGWTQIDGNYWMYDSAKYANEVQDVFTEVKFSNEINNATTYANPIAITAYAVQAEGFDTAAAAWGATFGKP